MEKLDNFDRFVKSTILDNPAKKKLNLACGKDIKPINQNWINCDMIGGENIIELDIFKLPLPFESNTFDYVLAKHILEHIPHNIPDYGFEKNFLVIFIEELHRIMKDSAILEIQVPSGISTLMDSIDHKRVVTPKTFHIFYENDPYNYYTKCRFELISERRTPILFRAFNFVFKAVLSIDIHPLYSKNVRFYLRKL